MIKHLLDLIRHKVNDLFECVIDKDDGLDEETQLPRSALPAAILMHEMRTHQVSEHPFCLMLIELSLPGLDGPSAGGQCAWQLDGGQIAAGRLRYKWWVEARGPGQMPVAI